MFGDAGRMHMETFCALRKHPRARPLLRPQANSGENAVIATAEFAEGTTVALRMNFSRENFYPRYPGVLYFAPVSIRSSKLACIHTTRTKLLCERLHGVIATA